MSIASSEQHPAPTSPLTIGLGFAVAIAVASLIAPRDNRAPDQPANLDSPHPFLTQVKASVDSLTHWQPRAGQIRITLESTGNANLADSNLSVYFRWRTKSNTGHWTRTPNVHVVDLQNAQKLTVAAEVPELPPAPLNGILGWISGNGDGVGEFLGLVPVAEVWISAQANRNASDAALADVVEPIGITNTWGALGAALGAVVPLARELGAEVALGPVDHRRGEREGLDGHALPVHGGDALGQVPVARLERRGAGALDDDGGAARVGAIDLAARRSAILLDGAEEALGEEVRVDVDRVGPGHGRDCTIEATSTEEAAGETSARALRLLRDRGP